MTLIQDQGILIAQRTQGKSHVQSFLRPDKANRHGLITGATGTGKTITLQTLAEVFPHSVCRCSWQTSRVTSQACRSPAV
jgi:Cdc6-like AAA superfamily ATPase